MGREVTTYLLLALTDDGRATLRRLRKCSELTYRVEPPNDGTSNIRPIPDDDEGDVSLYFRWELAGGWSIDVVRLPEVSK